MNRTIESPKRNRGRRLGAFTIMELIVTIAAMSIMMAAFGNILLQCKRVVSSTHRTLRMNHRISVVADLFRRDIGRLTKDGFLCITEVADGMPAIIFTVGGDTQSVVGDVEGIGAIVAWGIAARQDPENLDILWRPEYVLYSQGTVEDDPVAGRLPPDVADFLGGLADNADTDNPPDGILDMSLETLKDIKAASHAEIAGDSATSDNMIDNLLSENDAVFRIPPPSKAEADKLWKAVCKDIDRLSIAWTDYSETANGGFKWYGLTWSWSGSPTSPWVFNVVEQEPGATTGPESYGTIGGGYRAVWTSHEPDKWPKAVRIQFWFKEEALPEGFGKVYEVVCDIP